MVLLLELFETARLDRREHRYQSLFLSDLVVPSIPETACRAPVSAWSIRIGGVSDTFSDSYSLTFSLIDAQTRSTRSVNSSVRPSVPSLAPIASSPNCSASRVRTIRWTKQTLNIPLR